MSDTNGKSRALARSDPVMAPQAGLETDLFELDRLGPPVRIEPDAAKTFSPWLLLRYKGSILGVFLVLGALAVGGIWSMSPPRQHKATAIVEVSPVIRQLVKGGSDMVPLYESFRASQVDYLTSPAVLDGAVQRMSQDERIRATNWYRDVPASPFERLLERAGLRRPVPAEQRLASALSAEAPDHKQLVYVSMSTSTPGEAKLILDVVLEEYVKFALQRASDSDLEIMEQLRRQIAERATELNELEKQAANARQQLGTGTPEGLVTQGVLRLDELESRMRYLETDIAWTERMLEFAESSEVNEAAAAQEALTTVNHEEDATWRSLRAELQRLRSEQQVAATQFGKSHWRMVSLEQAIAVAEQALREREQELMATAAAPTANSPVQLRQSLREMRIRMDVLSELLQKERQQSDQVSRSALELTELDARRQKTREMQQQLAQHLEVMEMNREVAGFIRTLPATEVGATNDKRLRFMAAGLVGALAMSVGLAFVRIRFSPTVNELGDVGPANGVFLGRLPLRRGRSVMTSLEQCPIQAEAVRVVRTALLNRLSGDGGKAVQITSANVGSGKSTLACLLARSLAQCGNRVLLVDADLRRPALDQRFGTDLSPGLVDVMAERTPESSAVHRTSILGLSLLTAGRPQHHQEFEMLANGTLARLIHQWRKQYDLVIIDGAPLLGTADAGILSRVADGTIFVVRERHCRRAALLEGLATLSAAGGKLLGTVFVGSAGTGYGYRGRYGYGYSYGYSYGYGYGFAPTAAEAVGPLDQVSRPAP
ncbi:MAG TPA: polysaccharide biosynthesis tyrosine autokinase [Phycisphaerae bacterium]|nr:polysaccharide biosynthesis tyrosine autokinase [Phycisphaerae bacterium]